MSKQDGGGEVIAPSVRAGVRCGQRARPTGTEGSLGSRRPLSSAGVDWSAPIKRRGSFRLPSFLPWAWCSVGREAERTGTGERVWRAGEPERERKTCMSTMEERGDRKLKKNGRRASGRRRTDTGYERRARVPDNYMRRTIGLLADRDAMRGVRGGR